MKKSYIASVMGLVLVAVSGQAMATGVGLIVPQTANVEFSAQNITSHTLTPVNQTSGVITGAPVIAKGVVTVSASAKVAVKPDVSIVDSNDTSLMHLIGTASALNTFDAYLSDGAGGAALPVTALADWRLAGDGTTVNYTVNASEGANVAADSYVITVDAAVYTE